MEIQTKRYIYTFAVIAVLLSALLYYVYMAEENETASDELRDIGTGEFEFWDRETTHPVWARAALEDGPLLIFTHSEGCAPCIAQTEICESLLERYSTQIRYFDYLSGVDAQSTEAFSAYDPDGEPHYIPLVAVVTNGPDGPIWHSWEGVVDKPVLAGWIEDAISYHHRY